jgi:lysophospholipase L1-like esterase
MSIDVRRARTFTNVPNPENDQDAATKSYYDLGGRLPANDLRYALQFPGTSGSYVSLGVKTYLDGKPFTFGVWVDFYNNALSDDGRLWGYGYSSGNNKGYHLRLDAANKKLTFFYGSTQITANNTYCFGQMWLVLTYDGATTVKVYKNNVLTDTLTVAARTADGTIGSYLAARDTTSASLNGAIDHAFLYDRVLDASELKSIFRDMSYPSGALFIYDFNERTGTTATDQGGAGNNGTITGGTYITSPFGNPNRLWAAPTTAQAAASNAQTIKSGWLFIGSSTTAGSGASALEERYTDVLGALLHNEFNAPTVIGGYHVRAGDSGWSTTGTVSHNTDGLGLDSFSLSASATLSQTFTNCTGFDIHYVQGPGQGSFTYTVDGGSPVTITPSTSGSANRHDGTETVSGLAMGSHALAIQATNACIINGVYVHNGDGSTGIRVYNDGKGSTVASDFLATDTHWTRAATLNIHAVVIMLGSNDFSGSVDPSTFKSNVYSLMRKAWVNLSSTKPDIYLVNSYKRSDQVGFGTVYLYPQYATKLKELANENNGVFYVDISGFFPLVNDTTHDPLDLLNSDNIHPNSAGHAFIARLLRRKLLPSV